MGNADDIVASLKQDFIEDTIERVDRIETTIDRIAGGMDEAGPGIAEIRREAHTVKGLAGSFGFPLVGAIAHRMEDYIAELTKIDDLEAASLVDFTSWIREIIESGTNPQAEEETRILRSLPTRTVKSDEKAEKSHNGSAQDKEILLVTATAVQAHFLQRELREQGFRTITARTAVEAFETVVQSHPDAIITAAVLDGLSGIELIRALAAMKTLADKKLGLLTSFDASHPDLDGLPGNVAIINNRGKQTSEHLAKFIATMM
ncbi:MULTISPECIES: Hpt domain-containing protein [Thalassospira]|jgi:chemotaxis protein histidine kinase CheA|uniref:Histidine kinase n=1 Tax=Thalassospira povalilytica TaxID=732237 RepID=A0A8I1SIA7_9PROT|nr:MULTISPECIES: Hpt domain-containing protein [Thalassospira]RCK27120.1 histidine kinase [Thalassospira profundimaris]KZB60384.1 histidine kinase [Thalassospira sp. MCCC 1A02491]MBN8197122.1 Hpt domain-containing protein [Thalassospira povalilytica]MBO6771243.1 Hpt domain-containing protein [Thalassospira sp.]MCC4240518.1 Hpt domain-containing protein [Thalassospira povalilytica]|eukprot:TRINITY_DN1060_c0_g4_i1.p1 TRINITY_DN1060_c0_g4~~TRINITY_DN1060_c0_g4_i1.p1  ORF type:complete len:261 (+),score=45.16 TRINITY_DN1060_c0_g4_i1:585-1367(+)